MPRGSDRVQGWLNHCAILKIRFWWRVARVTAVTGRDLGPDRAGPSGIFIRGRELNTVTRHFDDSVLGLRLLNS